MLTKAGGVKTHILKDAMSRAPCLMFDSITELTACVNWVEQNLEILKSHFESTTRFGRLLSVTPYAAGRYLYIRCSGKSLLKLVLPSVETNSYYSIQLLLVTLWE